MDVNVVRKLILDCAGKTNYIALIENFDFLMRERITLVENQMRENIGLDKKELNKEEIIKSVKRINEIASENNSSFHLKEEWETIEAFLRMSILDDISSEFEKQKEN